MPREKIILGTDGEHWRAEGATSVLAYLAYPPVIEERKKNAKKAREETEKARKNRAEFQNCALAGWFHHLKDTDPEWARRPQMIPPAILDISRKKIDSVLGRAEKRICAKRLVAGQMLGTILAKVALDGKPLPIEIEGKRLVVSVGVRIDDKFRPASVNTVAEQMADDINNSTDLAHAGIGAMERADVINKIWMPAIPVAHLALALYGNIAKECNYKMGLRIEGAWLEEVLSKAEVIRQMAIKATRILDEETVQITLSESKPTE